MSEDLRARLARLRRDPAPAAGAGSAARAPLPVWLRTRLERAPGGAPTPAAAEAGERTAGPPAGLAPVEGPLGAHQAREVLLAEGHVHGDWRLDEALALEPGSLQRLTRGDAPAQIELAGCVFLDIETTGLSGGAGIHTFLVGLGWFEGGRLRVRQSFLRGPEEERVMLASVAERLARASLLVSFFGKSFDRHRLEDKMRLHGLRAPFAGLAHADLYWPCRRLYGALTSDTRLGTMERQLCGVQRVADLSGAHAPAAWFDFLAGRGHRLEEVLRHNFDDVLSLVTLLAHLGRTTSEQRSDGRPLVGEAGLAGARAAGLAELCAAERDHAGALEWLERARARGPSAAQARRLDLRRAETLERLGQRPAALAAWLELADKAPSCEAAQALVRAAGLVLRAAGTRRDAESCARAATWLERGLAMARQHCAGSARAKLEQRARGVGRRLI